MLAVAVAVVVVLVVIIVAAQRREQFWGQRGWPPIGQYDPAMLPVEFDMCEWAPALCRG